MMRQTLPAIALLLSGAAGAAQQDPLAVRDAVDRYIRLHTAGLPGQVSYSIGAIDGRMALPACPAFETFTPPGARLWGNTAVGVRCPGPQPWSIYITVVVRVSGPYLAAARGIAPGQRLTGADLTVLQGDLTQMPAGVLNDPAQAVGKAVSAPLAAGQPLRHESLRAPIVIQQGQGVRLLSQGPGFQVTAEGKALSQAAEGQVAQVRTSNGQTVTGIARTGGVVEVRY